jgi:hypothetical protein
MVSSGMLRRMALVRTDVSEELSASFIRVGRIGELGTTLAVTSKRHTLRRNTEFVFLLLYCTLQHPLSQPAVPTPQNKILCGHVVTLLMGDAFSSLQSSLSTDVRG